MEIKFNRISAFAKMPTYGSKDAAGADLYAAIPEPIEIGPGETVSIPTGLRTEIPKGFWGGIFARSGLSIKEGLRPSNCVGVIDSDYRGEIMVALYNDSYYTATVTPGQRIAQFILGQNFQPKWIEVNSLSETDRGQGGFGSTGRN